jgi:hypothetical protein
MPRQTHPKVPSIPQSISGAHTVATGNMVTKNGLPGIFRNYFAVIWRPQRVCTRQCIFENIDAASFANLKLFSLQHG